MRSTLLAIVVVLIGTNCFCEEEDPPHVKVGERLFLDPRFSQFFFANAKQANKLPEQGDRVMDVAATAIGKPLDGPYKHQSMNCRACHLVDEHKDTPRGGMRSYADFARRSPIPKRDADKRTLTLRNAPAMVNASIKRDFSFFHYDGEFLTMEDLVRGTLTGRNFGWKTGESGIAVKHIANIIKQDDGSLVEEKDQGIPYSVLLNGTDAEIPQELKLEENYRIDVTKADDESIVLAVAKLITAYSQSLEFTNTSPYDKFLALNELPASPGKNETDLEYSRRLLKLIISKRDFKYIQPDHEKFKFHDQNFVFGELELQGLKIFLAEPSGADAPKTGGVGNCISCHAAPNFTDFRFHNTGVAQDEYDSVHGDGEFSKIKIPESDSKSRQNPQELSEVIENPQFADIPSKDKPGHTDLGLWLVFDNSNVPVPQSALRGMLMMQHPDAKDSSELKRRTVAAFKTPGLRDLGHSAPYFHTGQKNDLSEVLQFYIKYSSFARMNKPGEEKVRNADTQLGRIHLQSEDVKKLEAFLRALNEDYE